MAHEKAHIKELTLEVDGEKFSFKVTHSDFTKFQREAEKAQGPASINFLLDTSTDREALKTRFEDDWVLPTVLIEAVGEAWGGHRKATVKK